MSHNPLTAFLSCLTLLYLTQNSFAQDTEAEEGDGGIGLAKTLRQDDRKLLERANADVISLLNARDKTTTSGTGRTALREMLDLLASKHMPIEDEGKLHGVWKVRSLQSGKFGSYSYPFFKCRIFPEARALVFHKATGSQRRMGFLERDSKVRFLFAGAMYFSDDPRPRIYKGSDEKVVKEDLDRNSVAWLYKIAANRLIMVFPSSTGRVEIYELKR